jgi:peptidyl-prolyl cis-trans isomerase SurA
VARQFSASPTAASGGDAGWVSQGDVAPEVEAALEQMRPGQLSQPIPVKDGVYIIYLRDKRSGATALVVNLKQAAIPLGADATAAQVDAARAKLEALRSTIKGCDNLESAAGKVQGVVAGDLGEAEIKDLAPDFRQAAESLQPGQVSEPIRTAAGLHLVAVCGKHAGGAEGLSHDEIEDRLVGQQLSMISRRYMRDLRNSATIETR